MIRFNTELIEFHSLAFIFSSSSNATNNLPANIELKFDFKGLEPVSKLRSSPITYFFMNWGKVDLPMPCEPFKYMHELFFLPFIILAVHFNIKSYESLLSEQITSLMKPRNLLIFFFIASLNVT